MNLILCIQSEELKSRIVAAAVMMQANTREMSIEHLLKSREVLNGWFLVDHGVEQIKKLISHLISLGQNPQKQIIRFIDKPWHAYVYHDIQIFASIVNPPDPIAAVEIIRKLDKSKPFLDLNNTEVQDSAVVDPFATAFVQSAPMKRAVDQLHKLAGLAVDTVFLGQTGVGKDTSARWLHEHSKVDGDFVHINCAALPEQLFEAELFGVTAGAFTGAQKDRPGKLEMAHRGTLYLDEIDSLPLSCQAKLLNVLQYRGATRLGGSKFYESEFRVIASTKVDFPELVKARKFREDLFFRLNISKVYLPSLSERLEDIGPMYRHFLLQASQQFNLPQQKVDSAEMDCILSKSWPGNVRELKAYAQRRIIGLEILEEVEHSGFGLKERLLQFEKTILLEAMKVHQGCTRKMSESLQIPIHSLYYRLKRFGILIEESDTENTLINKNLLNQSVLNDTQQC